MGLGVPVGAAAILSAAVLLHAAQDPNGSCVMIQELTAATPVIAYGTGCSTRLSPASTFKIPHALVALETGVVTAETSRDQ